MSVKAIYAKSISFLVAMVHGFAFTLKAEDTQHPNPGVGQVHKYMKLSPDAKGGQMRITTDEVNGIARMVHNDSNINIEIPLDDLLGLDLESKTLFDDVKELFLTKVNALAEAELAKKTKMALYDKFLLTDAGKKHQAELDAEAAGPSVEAEPKAKAKGKAKVTA